jgi:hypothetical protein
MNTDEVCSRSAENENFTNHPDVGEHFFPPYNPATTGAAGIGQMGYARRYRLCRSFRIPPPTPGARQMRTLEPFAPSDLRIDGAFVERGAAPAWIIRGETIGQDGPAHTVLGHAAFWAKPGYLPELDGKGHTWFNAAKIHAAKDEFWWQSLDNQTAAASEPFPLSLYAFASHDPSSEYESNYMDWVGTDMRPSRPSGIGFYANFSRMTQPTNWGASRCMRTSSFATGPTLNHHFHSSACGYPTGMNCIPSIDNGVTWVGRYPKLNPMAGHRWMHVSAAWHIPDCTGEGNSQHGAEIDPNTVELRVNGERITDNSRYAPYRMVYLESDLLWVLDWLHHEADIEVRNDNPDFWAGMRDNNCIRLGEAQTISSIPASGWMADQTLPGVAVPRNWGADTTFDELYVWGLDTPWASDLPPTQAVNLAKAGRYVIPPAPGMATYTSPFFGIKISDAPRRLPPPSNTRPPHPTVQTTMPSPPISQARAARACPPRPSAP